MTVPLTKHFLRYERNLSLSLYESCQSLLLKVIKVTLSLVCDFFIKFATKTQVTNEFLL